jgi:hypothetical protein
VLGFGAIVAAFIAFLSIGALWESRNQARLRKARSGYSESDFVAYFGNLGIPCDIPLSVYRYFQDELALHFPILPSDVCLDGLQIDDDDFTDAIATLWYRHDCKGTLWGELPIETVEDLVRFIHRYQTDQFE